MKQPEIKGGAASQTIATTLLAAILFFCFGCCPTYKVSELPDGNQRTNSMIFFATQFFNDKDVSKRADHYYSQKSADNKSVTEDISIYENYTGQYPYVTVAVNGIRTANSVSDKNLDWVNESTTIFINGLKRTYQELKDLEGRNLTVYYFKPKSKRARKKYGFVYVNSSTPAVNDSHYYYPVAIDNPDLDIPDIVPVITQFRDYSGGLLFTYDSKGVRIAAPEIKYAIEGRLVDSHTFLNACSGNSGYSTTVYRNNAAKDRFGKDVWEVVDLHVNRKALYVKFDYDGNGNLHAFIGDDPKVEATDDEIRAQIASILEFNRLRGQYSRIDALSYVPAQYDEMIDEWMGRLIDRSAPDIQYFFNRAQRSTVINPVTQDAFKHSKTIFYHDKVEYDYGNRRHLSRDVVLHTGIDSVKEDYKPNMIHIDEYDNMYLTVNQQTEDTDLKEIIDDIPGFSIDGQGQVTADGTTIRKVYLNGKEISL